jgi:hypothetical protein
VTRACEYDRENFAGGGGREIGVCEVELIRGEFRGIGHPAAWLGQWSGASGGGGRRTIGRAAWQSGCEMQGPASGDWLARRLSGLSRPNNASDCLSAPNAYARLSLLYLYRAD